MRFERMQIMKKVVLMIAALMLGGLLAGCGGQKSSLAVGQSLVKEGNCTGAIPYFDDTIAAPTTIMDLAYAYYGKGNCAEKAGDIPAAYENLYSAQVVACYAVANDTNKNLNLYARSEFCQKIIPERLAELAPKAGDVKAIRERVKTALEQRHLESLVSD